MKERLNSIKTIFYEILYIQTKRQKFLAAVLVLLTFINAFFQTVCIAAISVLVGIMTDQNSIMEGTIGRILRALVGADKSVGAYVATISLLVGILYVAKEIFCHYYIWYNTSYALKIEREISHRVLKSYLEREYDFFLNYGTANVIRDVEDDASKVNSLLRCFVTVFVEVLTAAFILMYIFVTYWQIAICIGVLAVGSAFFIFKVFKNVMKECGEDSRRQQAETRKLLMEVIGGIKEVQVMKKQRFYLNAYEVQKGREQKPKRDEIVIANVPTYAIEGVFVVGIVAFLGINALNGSDFSSMLPVLAATMVGGVRILPSLGRISSAINYIPFYRPSLDSVFKNMKTIEEYEKTQIDGKQIETERKDFFDNELKLSKIKWKYNDSDHFVINDLDLSISKGESIGIVGQSGAGKSTLADIILGLHVPQSGDVLIDGKSISSIPFSYSKIIGYVSQSVYLFEGTIRDNVAFGEDAKDIDDEKVWSALKQAQLESFVREQENGLDSVIGERGVKISGGQRQRLAIARALYREPQILVLDEATSALDVETESTFMHEVEELYGTITMIIIAHRLTTIKKCDKIYEIKDGKAVLRKWEEL